ncbi:zona pellucida sperm-binding protein 4-like [Stigmatopora nigra]
MDSINSSYKEMNSHFIKFRLIFIVFIFHFLLCQCSEKSSTLSQRQRLVSPRVICSQTGIKAMFGSKVSSNMRVRDKTGATLMVPQMDNSCGAKMGSWNNQRLLFFSTYDGCYAQVKGSKVVVPLQVQLAGENGWFSINITCPLMKRPSLRITPMPTKFHGKCSIRKDLRVKCGQQTTSPDSCSNEGCCYDATDQFCYHRLDSCSLDGHFVFAVKSNENPRNIAVKDQPRCVPLITTSDTAVFKIPVTDCGVKTKVNEDDVIYELELEEVPDPRRTNHSSFRLQVECKYSALEARHIVNLHSYAVTNPPPVIALGTFRLQMRIATDASFTTFFPKDQLPVMLPLRETLYLEISFAPPSPDPELSLHVRDCFAYPASRHSVWTLLNDGCPNHLDDSRSSTPVDHQGKIYSHSQVRRFDVKTFAFLKEGQPSVEEIYFYCWVEICTKNVDCSQRCSIISPQSERPRREASPEAFPTQLLSLGPLLLCQNSTKSQENPHIRQQTIYYISIYFFSGIVMTTTLLLLLLMILCLRNRKYHKPEPKQASDVQIEDTIT